MYGKNCLYSLLNEINVSSLLDFHYIAHSHKRYHEKYFLLVN